MRYQYLITTSDGQQPVFTNYYVYENYFNIEIGMVVYDLVNEKYTNNGTQWESIECDDL